jgi:hypothetical protein
VLKFISTDILLFSVFIQEIKCFKPESTWGMVWEFNEIEKENLMWYNCLEYRVEMCGYGIRNVVCRWITCNANCNHSPTKKKNRNFFTSSWCIIYMSKPNVLVYFSLNLWSKMLIVHQKEWLKLKVSTLTQRNWSLTKARKRWLKWEGKRLKRTYLASKNPVSKTNWSCGKHSVLILFQFRN